MIVLKVSFASDLRRISLEDGAPFQEAMHKIKQLFSLPITYCGLIVTWTTKDGEKREITNDRQWSEAVASANDTDRVIRLDIHKSAQQEAVPEAASILDRPDVRRHLEFVIAETIQSKPFVDLIAQKMASYIQSKGSFERQEIVVSETVPSSSLDGLRRSLLECKRQEEMAVPAVSSQVDRKESAVPVVDQVDDKEEKKEEEKEEKKEEKEEKEDSFVVQEIKEKAEVLATSPLVKSFLSFFKSFKKDEPKPAEKKEEEEKEITPEKLEEMIKQLNDMGFMDREENLRALKFHYKYNEGLDAVVEDLLAQRQPEKKEEEEPIPQQEEPKAEPVVHQPAIQQPAPVQPKGEVKDQQTETGIEGISEEDIERLMAHARISRDAAIKALRSQLW